MKLQLPQISKKRKKLKLMRERTSVRKNQEMLIIRREKMMNTMTMRKNQMLLKGIACCSPTLMTNSMTLLIMKKSKMILT